jgi:hypothetical protein
MEAEYGDRVHSEEQGYGVPSRAIRGKVKELCHRYQLLFGV